MLRRYQGGVGESFSRRVGYDFKVEISKSNRAACRSCRKKIPKGVVRFALMMQDEEGYKSAHWQHEECFWKHKDVKRHLNGLHELYGYQQLDANLQEEIKNKYCKLRGLTSTDAEGDTNKDVDGGEGENRNTLIAEALYKKAKQVKKEKPDSMYAGKAWEKGARIIELHPIAITSRKDAIALNGIGKKIADEVETILQTFGADGSARTELEDTNEEAAIEEQPRQPSQPKKRKRKADDVNNKKVKKTNADDDARVSQSNKETDQKVKTGATKAHTDTTNIQPTYRTRLKARKRN